MSLHIKKQRMKFLSEVPAMGIVLRAGAALGRQIAALLDPETPVEGVTTLKVRPDLKGLGELAVRLR